MKVEENLSTDVSDFGDKCVENNSKGDGNCEQKSLPNEESDTNQGLIIYFIYFLAEFLMENYSSYSQLDLFLWVCMSVCMRREGVHIFTFHFIYNHMLNVLTV